MRVKSKNCSQCYTFVFKTAKPLTCQEVNKKNEEFGIKIKTENIPGAGKCGLSLVAECRGVVGPVPKDGTLADCVEGVHDFLV